jgi:hypothetical protein
MPVDQRNPNIRVGIQLSGTLQPGKTAAHDNHMLRAVRSLFSTAGHEFPNPRLAECTPIRKEQQTLRDIAFLPHRVLSGTSVSNVWEFYTSSSASLLCKQFGLTSFIGIQVSGISKRRLLHVTDNLRN